MRLRIGHTYFSHNFILGGNTVLQCVLTVTGYCQLSMFWSTAQSFETSDGNTILKVNQLVLF